MLLRHPPGLKKVVILFTVPANAASAATPEVLRQKILHQVAAMVDKVSNNLTKQKTKYKRYLDKTCGTVPIYTEGSQVYVDGPPLTLVEDDTKTSQQCNKLLSQTTSLFTVMDVERHVISINKNGIPNNISFDTVTPVPTKNDVGINIKRKIYTPAQTTVPKNKRLVCEKPPKYVIAKLLPHRHTSKDLLYKVRWYE